MSGPAVGLLHTKSVHENKTMKWGILFRVQWQCRIWSTYFLLLLICYVRYIWSSGSVVMVRLLGMHWYKWRPVEFRQLKKTTTLYWSCDCGSHSYLPSHWLEWSHLIPTAFWKTFLSLQPLEYPANITANQANRQKEKTDRQCYKCIPGVTVIQVWQYRQWQVYLMGSWSWLSWQPVPSEWVSPLAVFRHTLHSSAAATNTRAHTHPSYERLTEEIKWKRTLKKRTWARIGLLPRRHLSGGRILEVRVQTTEVTTVHSSGVILGSALSEVRDWVFPPSVSPPKGPWLVRTGLTVNSDCQPSSPSICVVRTCVRACFTHTSAELAEQF